MAKKDKYKELDKLPQVIQKYIDLIIKKMRYRKSVRRDVQAELAAHFEDELRDCENLQQRERRAKELIEQFGDAKLLGILLRRAKKRCRPLWRTIVARTFQTIGVLILCFIIYSIWFLTGKPNIRVDYLAIINQKNKPELSEKDNAWPDYKKSVELFVAPDKKLEDIIAFKKLRSSYVRFDELDFDDQKKIRAWVAENNSAWKQYAQASMKPYCYRKARYNEKDEEKWLLNILLPELGTLRNLARLGIWRSRTEINDRQTAKALEDCLAIIRTGRFWQGSQVTIIEQLVGLSLSRLGHGEILNILSSCDVDFKQLQHIQQKLLDIYIDGYPKMYIEGERLMFMDVVQHLFTDGGLGGGHLIPERMSFVHEMINDVKYGLFDDSFEGKITTSLLYVGPAIYHARRDKTVKKANEIYDYLSMLADTTPYERYVNNMDIDEIIRSTRRYKYYLVAVFVPALDRASEFAYRSQITHEVTITILALRQCKLEQGQYPESLAQLHKQGYLHKIPSDPYSDELIKYRRTGDGFTLYSLGSNFIDDGGNVHRDDDGRVRLWDDDEGDAVFWPVQK